LGERAEMRVAGCQLGVGVADADDRPAVELVLRDAAVLHPRAIDESHLALAPEPLGAAALARCHAGSLLGGGRRLRRGPRDGQVVRPIPRYADAKAPEAMPGPRAGGDPIQFP